MPNVCATAPRAVPFRRDGSCKVGYAHHLGLALIALLATLLTGCAALIRQGELARVKQLLADGADVNTRDFNGQTPLHLAVGYKHLEVTKLLLEKGANVHAKDYEGNSPLQFGIGNSGGDSEIVDLLQSHGARG